MCKTIDNSEECLDEDACTWASGPQVKGYCRSIRKDILVEFGHRVKTDFTTYHVCSHRGPCYVKVRGNKWRRHVPYTSVIYDGDSATEGTVTRGAGSASQALTQYPFLVVYYDPQEQRFKYDELTVEKYRGGLGELQRVAAKDGNGYDLMYYTSQHPGALQSLASLNSVNVAVQPKVFLGKMKKQQGSNAATTFSIPQDPTIFSQTWDINATKSMVDASPPNQVPLTGLGSLAVLGAGNRVLRPAVQPPTPAAVVVGVAPQVKQQVGLFGR